MVWGRNSEALFIKKQSHCNGHVNETLPPLCLEAEDENGRYMHCVELYCRQEMNSSPYSLPSWSFLLPSHILCNSQVVPWLSKCSPSYTTEIVLSDHRFRQSNSLILVTVRHHWSPQKGPEFKG